MRTAAEAPAWSEGLGVHPRGAEPLHVGGFRGCEEIGLPAIDRVPMRDTILKFLERLRVVIRCFGDFRRFREAGFIFRLVVPRLAQGTPNHAGHATRLFQPALLRQERDHVLAGFCKSEIEGI